MQPKYIAIIPARLASTRLPEKPLQKINGKSLIQRVYERVCKCKLINEVIIATDHEKIANACFDFGANVVLTSTNHPSGTDRCNETASIIGLHESDVIINVQGDEPFLHPENVDALVNMFKTEKETELASMYFKINSNEELHDISIPKVILNKKNYAIYFSRNIIPFLAKEEKLSIEFYPFYGHIGIYGYTRKMLSLVTSLNVSSLEKAESLEQLRWIENGIKIKMIETTHRSISVDTPHDLKKAIELARKLEE